MIKDFDRQTERPVCKWFNTHENKAGDISGAWTRYPDTLAHLWLEGRQRTKLHWRKARRSPEVHDSKWVLAWEPDTQGFPREDAQETSAAQRQEAVAEALDWIVGHVAASAEPVTKSAAEAAYHEAHNGGRNLAREAIETELRKLETGETGGETPARLATTTGKYARATYLIPAPDAVSPLAATPDGETGETPPGPAEARGVASLAAARRDGETTGGNTRAGGDNGSADLPLTTPEEEADIECAKAKGLL